MSIDARNRMVAMLPRLRAFALSLSRSQTEADDLVQAACERALRSLHLFEEGTNFDAWLLRILRNLWIDGFRRSRNERLAEPDDPAFEIAGEDGRRTIELRRTLSATQALIAALPEEQRSTLLLVCVEGLSYRETADALGVAIGTVMSRLARARKAVSEGLDAAPATQPANSMMGRKQ